MKKIIVLFAVVLGLTLVGCSTPAQDEKTWDATMVEEYLQSVVDTVVYEDASFEEMVKEYTFSNTVTDEMKEFHLGSPDYTFENGIVRESMNGSIAFSLGMFVTETAEEATALAEGLQETLNPRKWICVGVEEDQVIATSNGNLVFYVMSDQADAFITAFNTVVE